jgi:hypothetical protein
MTNTIDITNMSDADLDSLLGMADPVDAAVEALDARAKAMGWGGARLDWRCDTLGVAAVDVYQSKVPRSRLKPGAVRIGLQNNYGVAFVAEGHGRLARKLIAAVREVL